MLKYGLLVGAMTISVPVAAQVATKTAPVPATRAATPVPTAPAASTASMAAPDTVPAATGPTAQVAPATPQTTGAAVTAAQPATGNQVAQIVDAEFPTYDTDKDGKLSAAEFGAWMVALKTKTDPATRADSPATKKWNDAAFAQADGDKDKLVSKGELTTFLGKG